MGKAKRLKNKRQAQPEPGDTVILHRDIFTTPAGTYRLESFGDPLIRLSIGDARIGISRESWRHCTVEKRAMTEEEVRVTYERLEKRMELVSQMPRREDGYSSTREFGDELRAFLAEGDGEHACEA